jgi:hypothetical protein
MWVHFCQENSQRAGCNSRWCFNSGGATCGVCRNIPQLDDCLIVAQVESVELHVSLCYSFGNHPSCIELEEGASDIPEGSINLSHDSGSGIFKKGDLIAISTDYKDVYTGDISGVGETNDIFGHPQNLMSETAENVFDRYDPSSTALDWSYSCHVFANKDVKVNRCFRDTYHMRDTLKKTEAVLQLSDTYSLKYDVIDISSVGIIDMHLTLDKAIVKWVHHSVKVKVTESSCKGCSNCLLGLTCQLGINSEEFGVLSLDCDGLILKESKFLLSPSTAVGNNHFIMVSGHSEKQNPFNCKIYTGKTILDSFKMSMDEVRNGENHLVSNSTISNAVKYFESSSSMDHFFSKIFSPFDSISGMFKNSFLFTLFKVSLIIIALVVLGFLIMYSAKCLTVVRKAGNVFKADETFKRRAKKHIFNRKDI